jgi:hypothetical protein
MLLGRRVSTDIVEVPIDLAKDAIDEAERGGNAPARTKELQNALERLRQRPSRCARKPVRSRKRF